MLSAVHYSHQLLDELIHKFPQGTFIDATLGNGNDFLYLLQKEEFQGRLMGFDIQEEAIASSSEKIRQFIETNGEPAASYEMIHDSHAKIDQYLQNTKIHGAVFNLGYLPGGDHSITTHFSSTYEAIEKIGHFLEVGGRIILVIYWGHEEGQIEKAQLMEELVQWPQRDWQVLQYQFINQINRPPYVVVLEKINHPK